MKEIWKKHKRNKRKEWEREVTQVEKRKGGGG